MSRLDKKCLVASAGVHGLFVVLLALLPLLWTSPRPSVALPPIDFIPSRLVDGAMASGGSPAAQPPPAAAPPVSRPEPEPIVVPPVAPPPPAVTKSEPKPKASDMAPAAKPEGKSAPSDKPARRKIEISLLRESNGRPSAAQEQSPAQARAQAAQAQRAARVNAIVGTIGRNVSSSTDISVPGPGGEAYADYRQFLILAYKKAWSPPAELSDELATVKVQVVIQRSGDVESFKILKESGHAALDQSVRRLTNVSFIARFPEGTRDLKRSFIINFNLTL